MWPRRHCITSGAMLVRIRGVIEDVRVTTSLFVRSESKGSNFQNL